MEGKIKFDSSDWNSIKDTISKVNEADSMQVGRTEDGEMITFAVEKSDPSCEEYDVLHTIVAQSNGWIRHNYYYPKDYTVEELFEHP